MVEDESLDASFEPSISPCALFDGDSLGLGSKDCDGAKSGAPFLSLINTESSNPFDQDCVSDVAKIGPRTTEDSTTMHEDGQVEDAKEADFLSPPSRSLSSTTCNHDAGSSDAATSAVRHGETSPFQTDEQDTKGASEISVHYLMYLVSHLDLRTQKQQESIKNLEEVVYQQRAEIQTLRAEAYLCSKQRIAINRRIANEKRLESSLSNCEARMKAMQLAIARLSQNTQMGPCPMLCTDRIPDLSESDESEPDAEESGSSFLADSKHFRAPSTLKSGGPGASRAFYGRRLC